MGPASTISGFDVAHFYVDWDGIVKSKLAEIWTMLVKVEIFVDDTLTSPEAGIELFESGLWAARRL